MKKYITIAALLAAGSALANAVTLDGAAFSTAGNAGYNTLGNNFTVALTLDVAELRMLLERNQTAAWGTNIINYVCNGTNTGVTVNGAVYVNTDKINNSGLYARWGETTNWNSVQWQGNFNLSDLNGDVAGTGWGSVSFAGLVYSFSATNGTTVAFTLLDASGNAIVDSYVTAGTLKSASAGVAALTFDDSVATSYYFNSYMGGNADNMKALSNLAATTAPIPEPSTFGLLAGLGALALVGTRRRRK